jgi:hypothetical protein
MNSLRTTFLLAALTALFMGIGYLFGGGERRFAGVIARGGPELLSLLER